MKYLRIFSFILLIFIPFNSKGQDVLNDKELILKKILDGYSGLKISLCKNSLSFKTEIIDGRTLKESLNIDFIEKIQRYSPPKNDKLISEYIDRKDAKYMISNISSFKWEKTNSEHVNHQSCDQDKMDLYSYMNYIKISKPLFTQNQKFAIVFISETSPEYSVYMKAFIKNKKDWVSVINLSLQ